MNYQKEIANRQIGQTFTISSTGTVRLIFGPFTPGEYLPALRLVLVVSNDTPGNNTPALGRVSIRAFSKTPGTATQANFFNDGRAIAGSVAGAGLRIGTNVIDATSAGSGALQIDLPISHVVDGDERFVGIELQNERSTHTWDGSVWVVAGHSDQHDSEE